MANEKAKKIAGGTAHAVGLSVGGVMKFIMTLVLIILLTGLMFMCIFAYYVKSTLMDEVDLTLTDFTLERSTTILYHDEDAEDPTEEWKELCMIQGTKFRVWKDLGEIPVNMQRAIVAIEDRRFYDHKGVDWYRTVGAFANMFLTMRNDFGGSTITQQLIKNLTQEDDITVQRKLMEIFRALDLEKKYDKDELIEYYLNAVFFGRNCYGVEAAAQTYFGKSISECSLAECASIAGITNNPSRYDPFVSVANNKERQETILWEMYDQGYISHDEYVEAINEQLKFVRSESSVTEQYIYSYYEETVIEDVLQDLMAQKGVNRDTAWDMLTEGGYQIYSCYDPKVQKAVDDVYTNVDGLPKAYRQPSANQDGSIPQLQSAIMVMEPTTGEVVAMSGGTGVKEANFILNRATGALRTPGSAFKPLASYGPAMEYGLITSSTEINDSADIKLSGTSWYPHNTPDRYDGWITIQYALAQSKNTAAAQIIDKLTPQTAYDFVTTRLGFTSLIPEDADYVAMALGDMHYGVTVREMTQAYCAFMNEGTFTYSRTYTKVVDPTGSVVLDNSPETVQAFSTATANNMVALLRNNVTGGIAGAARLNNMPSAGKTGTASNNKNRYFAGFTPYYTAAVWTGYDENQTMSFSGNPALDIWKAVMNNITVNKGLEYKELPTGSYQKPTGIFGSKEDDVEPTPTPTPSAEPSTTPEPTPTPPPSTPTPPVNDPWADPNLPAVD
ncbi:MAG: hypothetical protein HFG45_07280 [Oscillospiraceae bacterium]|jgi:penicillin-binding protein 1A|nr:hypothetical protein [Oscillospiraceae bacterium]